MLDFTGSKIFENTTHHIPENRSRNMGQYMGQPPNTQMGLSHLTSEIVPLNCPIFRIYSETVPPLTRAILEHSMGQMGQLGQFTGNFRKERRKYIGKGFRGIFSSLAKKVWDNCPIVPFGPGILRRIWRAYGG